MMAASPNLNTLSPSHHSHTQTHPTSKRRKNTATTTATVASDIAWCCAPSSPSPSHLPHRHLSPSPPPPFSLPTTDSSPSPQPVAASPLMDPASPAAYPSSYIKFNSVLNAGLLNPMSPPPRSSPTLFDMMTNEHDYHPRTAATHRRPSAASAQDCQLLLEERLAEILGGCSPGNQFNDTDTGDVRLTLSSRDGASVSVSVHRHILVAHSRFFAAKLSDRWSKQQRSLPHLVDISDCDDVAVYIETLRLMYSKDLRRRLMREDVSNVLGILKVSAAIAFDAGVLSCLEYLEAAPWTEDDEEKVATLLSQLNLESSGAGEVLKRVTLEVAPSSAAAANGNDAGGSGGAILLRLLQVVLDGKDEKARREMKGLVSKMLRENNAAASGCGQGGAEDLSKESLYSACGACLRLLRQHFNLAAASDMAEAAQIARQADNLHWVLDILIDRQIADQFLQSWASEAELAESHKRVPAIHRHEVSRVTARLFVGIGKGQILVAKEARCLLLRTWLEPFYEDFGWMRRACKGLDRHLIEDGLGSTILTLPLAMQQEILLAWFDRFLNSGDDCPNIQRAFEVWWRRAFWRRNGDPGRPPLLRIAANCDNVS